MSKPLPRHVPSDDCAVTVDGTVYYPHVGESVDIFPLQAVGELLELGRFEQLSVELDAAKGESDETRRTIAALDKHFVPICQYLANRLVSWDWTDLRGRPYPPPDAETLMRLDASELLYLMTVSKGESPAQRKNGSAVSKTTLSATASAATAGRKSTGGRSRTTR